MKLPMKSMLIFCILLLMGCKAEGEQPQVSAPRTVPLSPVDDSTLNLLNAAGTQALVSVIVWPDAWMKATADSRIALSRALSSLLERRVDSESFNRAPDALGGLLLVLGAKGGLADFAPGKWPGWDPERPMVAALFEAPIGYLELATAAFETHKDGRDGELRHRVLVPAVDAPRLAKTLGRMLPPLDERIRLTPGQRRTLRGGSLHHITQHGLVVAIVPEIEWVRIEVFRGDERHGKKGDFFDASSVDRWLRTIRIPVQDGKGAQTPATQFIASASDRLGAIYVRSWLLRSVITSFKASVLARALQNADPAERSMLFSYVFTDVLKARVLASDRGAETVDVALMISAPAPLRIKYVVSLTETGSSVYRAALGASDGPGCLWFDSSTPIDAPGAISTAVAPPAYELLENGNRVMEWLRSCGQKCVLAATIRQPVGTVVGLMKSMGRDPAPVIAKSFSPKLFSGIVPEDSLRDERRSISGLCGNAIVSELVVGAETADGPVFSPVPRYADFDWKEPEGCAGSDEAESCLLRMLVEVVEGLGSLTYAEPEKNKELISSLQTAQKDNMACAGSDPALRREASGVQKVLELLSE